MLLQTATLSSYFIYFKFTPAFFYLMFLMDFCTIKVINKLLSQEMSNIYLKVTIEKS